tara:strand:- start:5788 stop:6099 length:312 start_codon:yes stop_codon:yes gene_type:complete
METITTNKNKISYLFAVENPEQLTQIKQVACTIFGGYTLTTSQGGWTSKDNELMQETSYKLEIITDKEYKYINNLAQHITKIGKQKEVYFYIDNLKLNIVNNY